MNNYIVLDIETTGLRPEQDKITEIGAVKIIDGDISEVFSRLINPQIQIPQIITEITGITNEMVKGSPDISVVLPEFIEFCEGYDIMGHNVRFDFSFLKYNAVTQKLKFNKNALDTLALARKFLKQISSRSLTNLCEYYSIEREHAHRGYDDAKATYKLYKRLKEDFWTEETADLFIPKPIHYKPAKQEAITPRQEKYLKDLISYHNIDFKEQIDSLTKSQASRFIDKIISENGAIR